MRFLGPVLVLLDVAMVLGQSCERAAFASSSGGLAIIAVSVLELVDGADEQACHCFTFATDLPFPVLFVLGKWGECRSFTSATVPVRLTSADAHRGARLGRTLP